MQFQYGSTTFDSNMVSFASIQKSLVEGQNGRPLMRKIIWNIDGKIVTKNPGSPQTDVMNQYANVLSAFSVNYQNAGFSGTPFWLDNNSAIGGVIVSRPVSHGPIKGAEGTTYLKWSVGLEANYSMAKTGTVLAFSETMSFTSNDGLPIYVERIPVVGLPILQQVTTNSWYYGTQQGSMTMAFISPDPLPMLFPGQLRTSGNNGVQVSFKSPDMLRGAPTGFTTTWKYEYVSAIPFFSYPAIVG